MSESRDTLGRYSEKKNPEDAIQVFRQREDQAEPLTAADVLEHVDWSERTVYNKLNQLVDEGTLKTRKAGPGRVWWVPIPKDVAPLSAMGLTNGNIPRTPGQVLTAVGESLAGRNEETRRKRAEAVLTAYEYLQHEGRAKPREIHKYTYERHPLVDGTNSQSPQKQMWVLFLKDALKELPRVEAAGPSGGFWNFIDEGLEAELPDEVDDWIVDQVETAGSGMVAENQRGLVQLAYDHLRDIGEGKKKDFKAAMPSDYTAHYANFDGLWAYLLRDALKNAPGVEAVRGQRGTTFRYVGDENE